MTLVGGRWIAQHGLPHHDHLTVAGAGRRWIDEQWLAQWLMYELWRTGGYALVAAVAAALVASAFGILAFTLLERGSHPRRAVKWTVLAFATSLPDVAVRAQDFAYPLFALLVLLALKPPTLRRVSVQIALLVVWTNLHGSVLVGALLVAAACARRVRYLPAAAAALATPLATPYGWSIVHYYRSVLGNPSLQRFASEWKPATAEPIAAVGFFALVLAVGYVLVRARRRGVRPDPWLTTVCAVLLAAGFAELRWEAWAAFPCCVLATDVLNVTEPGAARPVQRRVADIAIALAAVGGILLLTLQSSARFEQTAPRRALAAVARYAGAHPGASVLADDDAADALLWKYPSLTGHVAFDDRLEVFPPGEVDAWADWIRVRRPPLPGYRVLVASKSSSSLVTSVEKLSRWRVIAAGNDGAAAVR